MTHQATVNSSYRWQVVLMAGFVLFFALWFLYDAYVGYPRERTIAREFTQFKEDARVDEWAAYAQARGWPEGLDGDPGHDHSDMNILTQKLLGYPLLSLSALVWVSLLRLIGRRIESDNGVLTASWGPRMPYDAITSLNLNRWKTKGIAVAHYKDESGKTQRFVLDNFKYTRGAITAMVEEIESGLDPDKIISNEPKPPA